MRRTHTFAPAALTLLCLGSFTPATSGWAQSAEQPSSSASSVMPRARAAGYLGADAVPDHHVFLPPPPAVVSPAGMADLAIFRATRSLEGGPRWQLAASDDRIGARKMLGDFGCAMGVDLTNVETPVLARTMARANADLLPMVGGAKDHYQRPRPFVAEPGPICVDVSPQFAASGSYPSGHSAAAWLYALLLSEIDPGNAAAIVARGRAFGESRVVCGVHYVSDVEGGRLTTTALVAALHSNAEFEADIAAARAELAAVRATAPTPDAASCPANGALAKPW
jgi:acid phosphatase (class A)